MEGRLEVVFKPETKTQMLVAGEESVEGTQRQSDGVKLSNGNIHHQPSAKFHS